MCIRDRCIIIIQQWAYDMYEFEENPGILQLMTVVYNKMNEKMYIPTC